MDPTANLLEQIARANAIQTCGHDPGPPCDRCADRAERLAELVLALDGWLRGGGFLPTRWATPERR